jgi:hypothetical protein
VCWTPEKLLMKTVSLLRKSAERLDRPVPHHANTNHARFRAVARKRSLLEVHLRPSDGHDLAGVHAEVQSDEQSRLHGFVCLPEKLPKDLRFDRV